MSSLFVATASATTDVTIGTVETPAPVQGSGDGEFRYGDSITHWFPNSFASPGGIQLVSAQTIRVSVKEETRATLNVGGKEYSHADGDTKFVKEFQAAKLQLTEIARSAHLAWRCDEGYHAVTGATSSFAVRPPVVVDDQSVRPASQDARAQFEEWKKGDLELVQLAAPVSGVGDCNILLQNVTFSVRDAAGAETYRAVYDGGPVSNPAARASSLRIYILEIVGGTYDTRGATGESRTRAQAFEGDVVGSISIVKGVGDADGPAGREEFQHERVDLTGELALHFAATHDDRPSVSVRFEQRARSTAAAAMGTGSGPGPTWTLPLTIGGVLALAGIAAARFTPRPRANPGVPTASTRVAPKADEAPTTPIGAAEAAYRAEPGNIQRAMELALHYANENRHADALPLLLMTVRHFPKSDVARYATALALLQSERVAEAVRHLEYAFRLNPMNVARFVKEGPARMHGKKPEIEELLNRWARVFHESNSRGYA